MGSPLSAPCFDVCLETVFNWLPVEERIGRIAEAGYRAVELWMHDSTSYRAGVEGPMRKDAGAIRQACDRHDVSICCLVVNGPTGEPGGAPVRAEELNRYLERVEEVIAFAMSIGCRMGITCTGNVQFDLTPARMRANLEMALGRAAEIAARHGFLLVLEALNTRVDHAGYYLNASREGFEIVRAISNRHLKLLYDIYHMQMMEGNLTTTITANIADIGHIHAAGVPGRHELFTGEVHYPSLVRAITESGYQGCFGLEYVPAIEDHSASLRKTHAYLNQRSE
ncbi:MAG: Hydroxypyruvate isomerase [bacterium ADurb.Bin429]|nr:MAG: Hydroxypyruvate isomerase [bacterium ADurb.Bin429]